MIKIEFFNSSLGTVIIRYYFLMAVVTVALVSGVWQLGLLALPIFLSAILGVSIRNGEKKQQGQTAKQVPINKNTKAA